MGHDPLTEIVVSLDLAGAVFLRAEVSAPWALDARITENELSPRPQGHPRLMAFHVVTEGEALVFLDRRPGYRTHLRASAGDVIFSSRNSIQVLASTVGERPVRSCDLLLPAGEDGLMRIEHGGGGDRTRMLGGFIASYTAQSALLDMLPEVMITSIKSPGTRQWIETSFAMAATELQSGRMSSVSIAAGLCRLLLVEALREHLEQGRASRGALSAMAHPRISKALTRIHADLAAPLRVEVLAREVGMSRSSFVDRFTDVVGVGPRQYVTAQRIETAAQMLRDTALSIAEIAYHVGYDAPEAFSRAFKRETGHAPVEWRHLQQSVA